MKRRIIATGFTPWGDHQSNTSWDCLEALDGDAFGDVVLEKRLVPVAWREAREAARAIVASQPDAVLAFGQYDGDTIRLERQARSRHAPNKADIRGELCCDSGIWDANARYSQLPLAEVAAALEEAKIPVAWSEDAGDFLCNYFFYRLMIEGESCPSPMLAGFIHVPQPGRMERSVLTRAIKIAIGAVGRRLDGAPEATG